MNTSSQNGVLSPFFSMTLGLFAFSFGVQGVLPAQDSQASKEVASPAKPQNPLAPSEVLQTGKVEKQGIRLALHKAMEVLKDLKKPIRVDGVLLDQKEVDRQTVYLAGQRMIRKKLIEMLVDDQIAQQIKEGKKKASDFKILEDEVTKSIKEQIETFKKKNPSRDFYAELRKAGISKAEFKTLTRSTMLFDKIFFPGIPKNWPDLTKEAIIASGGAQGQAFFQRFEEAVKKGQKMPPLLLQICRQWVLGKLQEWSDIKYASDGLPLDLCLTVNGRTWRTEDALRAVAPSIKPEDRARALTEIVLSTALKKRLKEKGFWLDDAAFKKEFEAYRKPYAKSPFNVKVMALTFKGYPSFEAYKVRWRLEKSFEHMIAKEINDENLAKHGKAAAMFLGDGRLSASMIRIPAFDDSKGTWKPGGFAIAKAKALKCMDEIKSGALDFAKAKEKYSFWPEARTNQGEMGNKSLNEFRQELQETEYSDFIAGYAIAEEIFFHVPAGAVAGPFKGRDGYYIVKVTGKQQPVTQVNLGDKNMRDLVKQDYLSHRFLQWANQVASKIVLGN